MPYSPAPDDASVVTSVFYLREEREGLRLTALDVCVLGCRCWF